MCFDSEGHGFWLQWQVASLTPGKLGGMNCPVVSERTADVDASLGVSSITLGNFLKTKTTFYDRV